MGSSCSSANSSFDMTVRSSLRGTAGRRSKKQRQQQLSRNRALSMTSSCDVEVEISKPREVSKQQPTPDYSLAANDGITEENNSLTPVLSMDMLSVCNQDSNTAITMATSRNESPKADVKLSPKDTSPIPSHLVGLAPEMQNLLMGLDPVPPSLTPRVIKLYVAADDTDMLTERLALTNTVFPCLRVLCEELGYHLDIIDLHWPLYTAQPLQLQQLVRSALSDDINLWLVMISEKLGWNLPFSFPAVDFEDICSRIPGDYMKKILHEQYFLDKNSLPHAYVCVHPPRVNTELQHELYISLYGVMTDEENELYMMPCLFEEVTKALNSRTRMSDNIVAVVRSLKQLTEYGNNEKDGMSSDPLLSKYFDVINGRQSQILKRLLQRLKLKLEQELPADLIVKCAVSWEDALSMELIKKGSKNTYLNNLCERLEEKLRSAIKRATEDKGQQNIFTAAGMPQALTHELLLHTHKRLQLISRVDEVSPTVYKAVTQIHSVPHSPLILYGPPGSGISTTAAHLADEIAQEGLGLVALRFLGLSPDARCLPSAMFSILEQITIAFGRPGTKHLQSLSHDDLLSSIAFCAAQYPLTIILSGLEQSMLDEERWWPPRDLPMNVCMVVLTSDTGLIDTWTRELPPKCFMEFQLMSLAEQKQIFTRELHVHKRCVTQQQEAAVHTVLQKCSQPLFPVIMALLAKQWTSSTFISVEDLPLNVEEAIQQILLQLETTVGQEWVARIASYLTIAWCGMSESELNDVLAIDNSAVLNTHPKEFPALCRCPQSVWLYFRTTLAQCLDKICLQGHTVYKWSHQTVETTVRHRYLEKATAGVLASLHGALADFFQGRWAKKPELLSDADAEVEVPHHFVLPQSDDYDGQPNARKLLCLLYHLIHSQKDAELSTTVEHHVLDIDWLIRKLEVTSTAQALYDLRIAAAKIPALAEDTQWLAMVLAHNTTELTVSGKQLCNYLTINLQKDEKRGTKTVNIFLEKIKDACASCPGSFLSIQYCSKFFLNFHAENYPQQGGIDGLYLAKGDPHFLVSISRLAGEVAVWDARCHKPVITVTALDKPRDLVFIDDHQVLVLCNRELRLLDLNTGTLVTKLPGMLNLSMPFFCMSDASTVIILSRNRMSINVLDVYSGQTRTTFKAGEDRFLNSLLVSADGSKLVCGEETQKPSPLLVWDLCESKLLHDLRLPQHEFVTKIADITDDGNYVACACKELSSPAPKFVVVYDLVSGQLLNRFKMATSVTCLAVGSTTMCLIIALDNGSLASFSLVSGNCNFHVGGAKAIYNQVKLSLDATMAVTYSSNTWVLPSTSTVAMWDITNGKFLSSYTFNTQITCCQLMPHDSSVIVGLASCRDYVSLGLHCSHLTQRMSCLKSKHGLCKGSQVPTCSSRLTQGSYIH